MIKKYAQMLHILLIREWYVYRGRLRDLLFNFLVLSPLKVATIQGYVKPMMYFGYPLGRRAMLVFAGSVLIYFIHRSFSFAMAFFFDLNRQHQAELQSRHIPLWLVYMSRVLFAALFTWCVLVPMIPLCKVILRTDFYTEDTRWLVYVGGVFLLALLMNTYAFMCVAAVDSVQSITKIRVRLNEVLMWLGAFSIPWAVMNKSHRGWGIVGLCNPFTYGTEFMRAILVPGDGILPIMLSVCVLTGCAVLFLAVGYYFTTRRIWNGFYRPIAVVDEHAEKRAT